MSILLITNLYIQISDYVNQNSINRYLTYFYLIRLETYYL